jgi:hypothetical protein
LLDVDGFGLQQIVQHSNFLQYPQLVTPIRQMEHGPTSPNRRCRERN